jgi:hypothetical protein
MTFDQFLSLCERAGVLDRLRNIVDAVDQLPVMVVLALHLQRLELGGRINVLPDRPLGVEGVRTKTWTTKR